MKSDLQASQLYSLSCFSIGPCLDIVLLPETLLSNAQLFPCESCKEITIKKEPHHTLVHLNTDDSFG